MPKAKLKIADHSLLPGESVIEVYYEGEFIASIYGADGPGVRIISKHKVLAINHIAGIVEIALDPTKET